MDRVAKILAYLEAKAAGDEAEPPPPDGSGDEVDRIVEHLAVLDATTRHDAERIARMSAAMVAMGAAPAPDPSREQGIDAVDALSMGVNMLAEELEATTVSLDYLNDVLDSIPDAVFVAAPDGTIQLRNASASRVVHAVERVDQLFGDKATSSEFDVQLGEGGSIPFSVVASTLHAGHRVYVARDISTRLALEREVEDARDAALAASQMKSDFLATMSHEIRTPINGVVGMSQLLYATELSPTQQEMAAAISTSATALLELVNDVLDFSKIEAGRLELEHLEFDLVDMLEQVLDIHALAAARAGDELFLHVETEIPVVIGDDGRIRQVINNLLSNAIKFTEGGEIVIRVGAGPKVEGRAPVQIEVSDTGIGIEHDKIDRLFDAFSQADSSTARRYGGTGLGLAISRQLLDLMGGQINVASTPGSGTSFFLSLPLPVVEDAEDILPRLDGGRVLVVEPSTTGRQILADQLTRWGATPTLVANAAAARARLRPRAFDACIIEHRLPDGSGLELAQHVARDLGIPTLVVGSVLDRPARSALDAVGPWGLMTRPLRPRALRYVLERMLRGREPERPMGVEAAQLQGRVLVVEDNPINQRVTVAQLRTLALDADVAGDGAEAVEAFESLPYDLILMDVRMPTMDGYEATTRIRGIEAREGGRIPIVALTADALTEQRQRVLSVGMDDCLTKPVTIEALAQVLARWLPERSIEDDDEPEGRQAGAEDDDEPVLDEAQLDELRMVADGDESFLTELFGELFVSAGEHVAAMRGLVASGDGDELAMHAHALKGAAANLGARRVTAACLVLEQRGRAGELSGVEAVLDTLEERLEEVRAAVEA